MDVVITNASENDLPIIEQWARSFDLDCEEIFFKQFIVAKKNNTIVGFGRLRNYPECTELATLGVIPEERNKGIGTAIVNELIKTGPSEIFVTCVIPHFFSRLGFRAVKKYPCVLQKKVEFCKCYNFKEEEIFVMKIELPKTNSKYL
jgi:N-acetylglutamate synthase-like GNAT family acetyltransferase